MDDQYRVIASNNPARTGGVIQIFLNGLGDVIDGTRPASGEITPASPLATTKSQSVVTIGGLPARVEFSGLAPLNAGLYQVNAVVPGGLQPGIQPIQLSIGEVTAKSSIVVR
jgi:uncharacterized protein (TIGR03437 family)